MRTLDAIRDRVGVRYPGEAGETEEAAQPVVTPA
ncbi:hypothetical protein SVIOM342S_10291 [Streptomyces violaceorubidus]